jgi:hypothetical protein
MYQVIFIYCDYIKMDTFNTLNESIVYIIDSFVYLYKKYNNNSIDIEFDIDDYVNILYKYAKLYDHNDINQLIIEFNNYFKLMCKKRSIKNNTNIHCILNKFDDKYITLNNI